MTELPKLLPASVDWSELKKLDLTNRAVKKHLKTLSKEYRYNQRLVEALDRMYDWQKQAIAFTEDHTVIGIISANQVGKTETAMATVSCHLTGLYPDWWEGKKYDRPVSIKVAGVDSAHNKDVLQSNLFGTNNKRLNVELGTGMLPRDSIIIESLTSNRGDDIQTCKVKHASGGMSEVSFKAYTQGREAAQGTGTDIYVIDEQPNDDFFSEAVTRTLTTDGHIICSFTPLKGKTGLVEKLLDLPDAEGAPEDKYGVKWKSGDDWAMIRASWDDVTHITQKAKDTVSKSYATFELAARTFGMPIAGEGRVFPFQEEDVIYDPRETHVRPEWEHLIGIDIGHTRDRDPSAAVMVALDEATDTIYVTACRRENTTTSGELSRMITGINHVVPVAWPSDANRTQMGSPAPVAELLVDNHNINLCGRPFMNPRDAAGKLNNFKMPGINYMNQLFEEGRLKISIECRDLLDEFLNYQYKRKNKNDPDVVRLQDGKDDLMDALRYAVMSLIQGLGEPIREDVNNYSEEDEDPYFNNY